MSNSLEALTLGQAWSGRGDDRLDYAIEIGVNIAVPEAKNQPVIGFQI